MAEEFPHRQFLSCRAAAAGDLDDVLALIQGENIASLIADAGFQRSKIGKSLETLSAKRSWRDGLLMLVTELNDGASSTIVGSAGINTCAGGYWTETRRGAEDILVFEGFPPRGNAFEFSGTCVAGEYRNRHIGTLHTVARIAFILMHRDAIAKDVGPVAMLCANLLPPCAANGTFPFYEAFVKTLLGGLSYRQADIQRYTDPAFFRPLLPGADHAGAELSLSRIKQALGADFAAVRRQTLGAERALTKYGFHQVRKYDALDAGHYVETTMEVLDAHMRLAPLTLGRATEAELGGSAPCYFAPIRPMAAFACARAQAVADGATLRLHEDILSRLRLSEGETVMSVVPQTA